MMQKTIKLLGYTPKDKNWS